MIRTAPNGDIFLAEGSSGRIIGFHGITSDGKPEQTEIFADGLNQPYGIAFYPPGDNPQWVYVGDTDSVVRFPYQNGDLKAGGPAQHIVDLPHGRGHWTRDVQFTTDGKKMFVAVGSASNVDGPDSTPAEKNRAVDDLDPARTQAVAEQGGTDAKNIAEVAGGVDVVLSCLTNDEVARSVYAGPAGVFAMVRPGTIVLEMSTSSPDSSQESHRLGAQQGIEVLDVAISGSTPAAERGLLRLLVGGDQDTFRAAEPVFQARYHLPHTREPRPRWCAQL